jgi:hypothetical protein
VNFTFSYVIRSDDYYPVFERQCSREQTVKEIFNLDNSAQFGITEVELNEEGTGNLCTFVSHITAAKRPDTWFSAAATYARLRDIDYTVTLLEHVEEEIPEVEPTVDSGVEPEVELETEPEIEPESEMEISDSDN